MSFVRFTPVMRFYWDVFRLSYAGHTFLSVCLAFDHACCLPHSAKQNGLRYVAFLFRRGSRSPFVRSRMSCGYQALLVHFGTVRFLMAIPTGLSGPLGYGTGGAAFVRFCVTALALSCFPRGVRWGKMRKPHCGRAPNLRQRVECGSRTAASLDSLHLIRGASEKAIQ